MGSFDATLQSVGEVTVLPCRVLVSIFKERYACIWRCVRKVHMTVSWEKGVDTPITYEKEERE